MNSRVVASVDYILTGTCTYTTITTTQEKKVCWFYTYRCAKSMSPVLTQCTCAETCTVLKLHMCCLHICAILAYEIVLLLMC